MRFTLPNPPAHRRPVIGSPGRSSRRLNLAACAAGLWAGVSFAQPDAAAPASPSFAAGEAGAPAAPAPGASPAVRQSPSGGRDAIGDATRALLELQRDSRGRARPIPGEQAGLSHQRYLDSFRRPIPDALDSTVQRGAGTGAGAR